MGMMEDILPETYLTVSVNDELDKFFDRIKFFRQSRKIRKLRNKLVKEIVKEMIFHRKKIKNDFHS